MSEESNWRKPRLRTAEEQLLERNASWLELFFDLVFVIVIVVLSHILAHDVSWTGLVRFILVFLPVWWIWAGMTFFNDRFYTNDISQRLFTFLIMLPVASLAVFINDGVEENSRGFAISFMTAQLLLILMWLRAGWNNSEAQTIARRMTSGMSLALVFWAISIFIPEPWRYLFWALGLAVDIISQATSGPVQRALPGVNRTHMPERFALIVIIVLGDSIIDVIRAAADSENISYAIGGAGVLGFAMAFSFWWVYFDNVMAFKVKEGFRWVMGWIYAHLLLVVALTSMAAGIFNVVVLNQEELPGPERWLICSSVSVSLFAIGLIELNLDWKGWENRARRNRRILRFGSAFLALLVGFIDVRFSADVVLALLVMLVILQEVPVFRYRRMRAATQR